MKTLGFIALFILFILANISLSAKFNIKKEEPIETIRFRMQERKNDFLNALKSLIHQLESDHNKGIIAAYKKIRATYKRLEYILEVSDPNFVKDHLNGAPLPKLERESFNANIITPKGLQELELALFQKEIDRDKCKTLITNMYNTLSDHHEFPIYDRDIFHGIRSELIRLYTLGLTGFDCPASNNSVADACVVLETIAADLMLYQHEDIPEINEIKTICNEGMSYLRKTKDREKINFLFVLKDIIDPLYKKTLEAQNKLQVEHPTEYRSQPSAWNYNSTSIFATDFLDAWYYTSIPKKYQTKEVVSLGKQLFFDPILSDQSKRSCASCHQPEKYYTDGLITSKAFEDGNFLSRNSPTLLHAIYSERYFWDLRARAIEDQTEHVVTSPHEFNTSYPEIIQRLQQSNTYRIAFEKAFQGENHQISKQFIQFALTAYVASLSNYNAPFDRYVRGEVNSLPSSVIKGFNIFMGKANCATCHFVPLFNGTVPPLYLESESENLGVFSAPNSYQLDNDLGRKVGISKEQSPIYERSFKTVTVRNSAKTAPYMHNGMYPNLLDIINFYNHGGALGKGVNNPYQTLPETHLKLTHREVKQLIDFLNALTDTEL